MKAATSDRFQSGPSKEPHEWTRAANPSHCFALTELARIRTPVILTSLSRPPGSSPGGSCLRLNHSLELAPWGEIRFATAPILSSDRVIQKICASADPTKES